MPGAHATAGPSPLPFPSAPPPPTRRAGDRAFSGGAPKAPLHQPRGRDNDIGAIDFDDSGFGFHAYDLVVPLTQVTHLCKKNPKKSFPAFVAAIQEGYASVGRWDSADAAALPYLFAARRLTMLGWLKSRSDIPELRKRLPATAKHVYEYLKTDWRTLR